MLSFSLFSGAKCYNCGQNGHYFCPQCIPKLQIYEGFDYASKRPSKNFYIDKEYQKDFSLTQVIVLTHYHQKGVKTLLRHAKFYGKYAAYRDIILPFSPFFNEYLDTHNSLLVPIPLHFLRRWKRGFNQSEKIAGVISRIVDISVCNTLLFRKKYTKHQSHLSKAERQTMLYSAFYTSKKHKIPKSTTIYLVDDVVSSGSTLLECANTLRSEGFTDVRAVVLASD
ncbi:hypothetical protein LAT59_02050 [Candidatus Gracilibacteria bacterium]|nr:hypothetical protein [Candidatus Gracilibacteria bacterium]